MSNEIDNPERTARWIVIGLLLSHVWLIVAGAMLGAEWHASRDAQEYELRLELDIERCRANRAEGETWWTLHQLKPPIKIDTILTDGKEELN